MASSSSPSASSSGSPSAPAAPFSGSLLLPALGAEVRETWWTRPWACAPRIGRSAGPLSCQGPCNPWRSARPTFSSSLSSRSWMLYTPRLQCWPQSSWDTQGLGKRNGVLGGLAGWEIRRVELLDVVHRFWGKAPHALLVAYRGKDLSEKRKLHPWKLLADINLTCFCHAGHCMLSLAWIDQPPKHWRTKIYTWHVSSINHIWRKHTKEFLCSTSIEIIEDDPPFKKRLLIRS